MPGGWQRTTPARPLPPDWPTRRLRVLRRDSYRCQTRSAAGVLCGAHASAVDHLVNRARGGSDDEDNLAAICTRHHTEKTQAEAAEGARLAREARPRFRPAETHPGALDPAQAPPPF